MRRKFIALAFYDGLFWILSVRSYESLDVKVGTASYRFFGLPSSRQGDVTSWKMSVRA
jgi:hypothetical protein